MSFKCGLGSAERGANVSASATIPFRIRRARRPAFTLTELMIVISIMAILAGLGVSAMNGATNLAREHRTGVQIAKIDQLIMERYEGYRTRAVPIRIPPNTDPRTAARSRLNALRELMRMELPDRRTDVVDLTQKTPAMQSSATGMPIASLQKTYFRIATRAVGGQANLANWTSTNEGAECLYLILSTMRDGDKAALDYFDGNEIGDTDGDGMLEILDGWGTPIEFLRWAPAYVPSSSAPIVTMQDANSINAPDPFDPAKVDPRWTAAAVTAGTGPYALYPLIFSAGPDRKYDIDVVGGLVYVQTPKVNSVAVPNDPYYGGKGTVPVVGAPLDADGDSQLSFFDNITNHSLATRK